MAVAIACGQKVEKTHHSAVTMILKITRQAAKKTKQIGLKSTSTPLVFAFCC